MVPIVPFVPFKRNDGRWKHLEKKGTKKKKARETRNAFSATSSLTASAMNLRMAAWVSSAWRAEVDDGTQQPGFSY